jgi:hypothetical protein
MPRSQTGSIHAMTSNSGRASNEAASWWWSMVASHGERGTLGRRPRLEAGARRDFPKWAGIGSMSSVNHKYWLTSSIYD